MGKRYTRNEEKFIILAVEFGMPHSQVAEVLGRTRKAIDGKARELGLSNNLPNRPWQEWEYRVLVENKEETHGAVADILYGRTARAVKEARARLRANPALAGETAPDTATLDVAVGEGESPDYEFPTIELDYLEDDPRQTEAEGNEPHEPVDSGAMAYDVKESFTEGLSRKFIKILFGK